MHIHLSDYNGSLDGLTPATLFEKVTTTTDKTLHITGEADELLLEFLISNLSKNVKNVHLSVSSLPLFTHKEVVDDKVFYIMHTFCIIFPVLRRLPDTVNTITFPLDLFRERLSWQEAGAKQILLSFDYRFVINYIGNPDMIRSCAFKRYDVVEMISEIHSKLSLSPKDKNELTLDLPVSAYAKILSYLDKKSVARFFYSLILEKEVTNPAVKQFLEDNGFSIYVEHLNKPQKYHTPLTFLVENKKNLHTNAEIISLAANMRKSGADLCRPNALKNNALHLAAQSGNREFITYLFNNISRGDAYRMGDEYNFVREKPSDIAIKKYGAGSEIANELGGPRYNE